MNEGELHRCIDRVRTGRMPRRDFIDRMLALGLSVPMAGLILMHAGVAKAQASTYKPTKRGGGGVLKLIEWQGPTMLNPHFATGVKDGIGSRVFYEPLAQWDADANLQPVLAAEIPSRSNGGLAADGLSVIWKLKHGVKWHDGQPFTADDVIFNWQYATDPAAATVTSGAYKNLKLEKIDAHTVRVVFDRPSPFWPGQYSLMMLVPRHLFANYMGAKSREAPTNLAPVGTGAYTFVDFKPGDLLRGTLNPSYHQPRRPFFDSVELKGGGDAVSAARAVLQAGEYDYAGSLVIEDDVLKRIEGGGKGRVEFFTGSATTAIYLNHADPNTEIEGERSHAKSRHPLFSDASVRRAIGLLIDRQNLQDFVFGRQGVATANFVNNPARYRSANTAYEFNIEKAKAILDDAGWKPGPGGVREKGGKKLALVFQTATGPAGQKTQTVVKQAAQKAGIEIELKAVVASVFFSSDAGNPDTYGKFGADIQSYNWTSTSPDPAYMMRCFVSWEVASKANKWLGQNLTRWQNSDFDALYRASETELDPVARAALFIRMNNLVVADGYVLPIIARRSARAFSDKLVAPVLGWANDMASLADWYRQS